MMSENRNYVIFVLSEMQLMCKCDPYGESGQWVLSPLNMFGLFCVNSFSIHWLVNPKDIDPCLEHVFEHVFFL